MKKTINLRQSQVKTLVEQALNELDWKTYMNAAKKAQERIQYDPFYNEDATDADFADYDKNYSRVPRFVDAARDAYRKKYGSERKDSFETYDLGYGRGHNPYNYERSYGDDYGENEELPDDDFWYSQTQTFFPETEDIPSDDFSDTDLSVYSRYGEENDGAVFDEPYRNLVDTNDSNVDLSKTSPEFRDVYNYHHGNSKYTKGQGWNESVARRIAENWEPTGGLLNGRYEPKRFKDIIEYYTEECGLDRKTVENDVIKALDSIAEEKDVSFILDDLYKGLSEWQADHKVDPRERFKSFSDFITYGNIGAGDILETLAYWDYPLASEAYLKMCEIDPSKYQKYMRESKRSVARRITENVVRLLKEQFNADDHTVIFDRPEEALRFIQKHGRGKETLAINTDKLYFGGGQVMVPNEDAVDFMTEMLDWGIDWDRAMERHTGGYAKLLTKDVILAYLKWLNEKEKGLYFTTNYDKNGNQKPLGRFATTMKDVYGR